MMPAYRCMDSCTQQRAPVPSCYNHYPMNGAIPPQAMMMDPEGFPVSYGRQQGPMPYHTCWGHNYFTSYSPPYAYVPAPFHGHLSYPVYPAVLPYQYDVLSHCPMEGSRFGTDRNPGKRSHCCGCPNHTHTHEGDRKLMIEEAAPEDGEKEVGPSTMIERIPPDYLKNKGHPYPVFWMPPDYLKNIEHPVKYPKGLMERQQQKDTGTSDGPVGSDLWKQFFPFDVSKRESLKQGAENHIQNQESEESNSQIKDWNNDGKNSQLTFPIMFLPSYGRPHGTDKTNEFVEAAPKSVENMPSGNTEDSMELTTLNDITKDSKMHDVSDGKEKVENGVDAVEKGNIKNIPVKQITHGEHTSHEDIKATGEASGKDMVKDIPVKTGTDRQLNKSSEVTMKKQCASARNSSKLPPICLRVDPLPRKRNGNGHGKSPSSPCNKTDSQESAEAVTSCQKKQIPLQTESDRVKDLERKKGQGITESTMKDDGQQTLGTLTPKPVDTPIQLLENGSVEGLADKEERKEKNVEYESAEGISKGQDSRLPKGTESANGNILNMPITEVCEPLFQLMKGKLSEKEAATVIQSAYRGFEVRRSEPLKKLKQIAEVRLQVTDVENQIHAIESSPGIQSSDKQVVVIGETIMSLLLKLDTIQGLHPIIRDVRKSMVRELTDLQGKLDSMTNARTGEQKDSPSVMPGECASVDSCTCKNMGEEEPKEADDRSCLDGLVRSSSPFERQSPKKAVEPSNCQDDEMVLSTTKEMNTSSSSKTGVVTVLDGKVSDQQIEAPVVAKWETQTNDCSLSVNSAVGEEGEGKTKLVAADYLVAVGDKIVDVRTKGHVSELELTIPEEKFNYAEPASLCKPEKTEKCEAELELQHEFAGATHWDGAGAGAEAEADNGVDFVSVEVEPEALQDVFTETYPDGDRDALDSDPVQKQPEGIQEEPLVPESENPLGYITSGVRQIVASAELETASLEVNGSGLAEASDDLQDLPTVPPSNAESTDGDKGDITEADLPEETVDLENESQIAIGTKNEEVMGQGNVQASLLLEDDSQDTPVVTEMIQEPGGIICGEGFGAIIGNRIASESGGQVLLKDIVECKDMKSQSAFELHGGCSELEPRDVDILDKRPMSPANCLQEGDGEKNSADSADHSHVQESYKRLIEENEKLRSALEKLIEAGKEQMLELSNLKGRVKDLEKKLRKKKPRTRRCARLPWRTFATKLPVAQ